jgi:hypothetical protein
VIRASWDRDDRYLVAVFGEDDVVEVRLTSDQPRADKFALSRVPTVLRVISLLGILQNLAVGCTRGFLGTAHGAPHSECHDRRKDADDDDRDEKFNQREAVRTAWPIGEH